MSEQKKEEKYKNRKPWVDIRIPAKIGIVSLKE